MTKTALIIVDYSVDFIADDGKLTCGLPGQKLENFLVNRINQFNENRDDIFFMMDLHYENDDFHPESKLFPPPDICVLHTAISAYNLGYAIRVPSKGVASFNQSGHQWALSHFENSLGAEVEEWAKVMLK